MEIMRLLGELKMHQMVLKLVVPPLNLRIVQINLHRRPVATWGDSSFVRFNYGQLARDRMRDLNPFQRIAVPLRHPQDKTVSPRNILTGYDLINRRRSCRILLGRAATAEQPQY